MIILSAKKIREQSAEEFITKNELFIKFQIILFVVTIILFYYYFFNKQLSPTFFLFWIVIIQVFLIRYSTVVVYKNIPNIALLEELDLKKYIEITVALSQKGRTKLIRREASEATKLNEAQVLYFKGNFQESLDMLDTINFSQFSRLTRVGYSDLANYYRIACKIQLRDFDGIETLVSKLKMNRKQTESIIKISKGESVTFFDNWSPKWKLEKISKWYNLALNHLNQDQPEEAKTCFQEIVNENPELFYVKEAKKYLEELA